MNKYRKKPVVIEAMELVDNHDAKVAMELWLDTDLGPTGFRFSSWRSNPTRMEIFTLEGIMTADVGDFIIIGVEGEAYPCKPSVFHKTYERVDDED